MNKGHKIKSGLIAGIYGLLCVLKGGMAVSANTETDCFDYLANGDYRVAYTYAGALNNETSGDTVHGLDVCSWVTRKTSTGGIAYDNRLFDVAEEEEWAAAGITTELVAEAKAAGVNYVGKGVDGAFRYVTTGPNGEKKNAWSAGSYYKAGPDTEAGTVGKLQSGGYIYFGLTGDSEITENDRELTFLVEYYDVIGSNVGLHYVFDGYGNGKYTKSKAVIGTGDGVWRTVAVSVDDAFLSATRKDTKLATHAEDFRITVSGDDLYLSRVMVIPTAEYQRARAANPALPAANYIPDITVGTEVESCPAQKVVDARTGRTYWYMDIFGESAIKPYVTAQSWNYDGTKFVIGNNVTKKMYEYDITTQKLRYLDYVDCGDSLNAVVTPNDEIFYTRSGTVFKIDWKTYTRSHVANFPQEMTALSVINVTNDGKYASGYYGGSLKSETDEDKRANLVRLNLETGEIDGKLWKTFDNSDGKYSDENGTNRSQGIGHPIINPVYPDELFFCHEGLTQYIPDRLWHGNFSTGEMYNMFIQQVGKDGVRTGEPSGHEVWSMDGESLYFVKYSGYDNTSVKPGIARISRKGDWRGTVIGSSREYLTDGKTLRYWHCYPSGDGKWVSGDTFGGEIGLVNTETYQEQLLCQFKIISFTHPYQPHPDISYGGASINWQMCNPAATKSDLGEVCVGWMDISDITGK